MSKMHVYVNDVLIKTNEGNTMKTNFLVFLTMRIAFNVCGPLIYKESSFDTKWFTNASNKR